MNPPRDVFQICTPGVGEFRPTGGVQGLGSCAKERLPRLCSTSKKNRRPKNYPEQPRPASVLVAPPPALKKVLKESLNAGGGEMSCQELQIGLAEGWMYIGCGGYHAFKAMVCVLCDRRQMFVYASRTCHFPVQG